MTIYLLLYTIYLGRVDRAEFSMGRVDRSPTTYTNIYTCMNRDSEKQ